MPRTKKHSKPQLLLLHCKCDQCTNWEIGYEVDPFGGTYYLICKTCDVKIKIDIFSMLPHASLHWEKANA